MRLRSFGLPPLSYIALRSEGFGIGAAAGSSADALRRSLQHPQPAVTGYAQEVRRLVLDLTYVAAPRRLGLGYKRCFRMTGAASGRAPPAFAMPYPERMPFALDSATSALTPRIHGDS